MLPERACERCGGIIPAQWEFCPACSGTGEVPKPKPPPTSADAKFGQWFTAVGVLLTSGLFYWQCLAPPSEAELAQKARRKQEVQVLMEHLRTKREFVDDCVRLGQTREWCEERADIAVRTGR